jgi:hypothetical protein
MKPGLDGSQASCRGSPRQVPDRPNLASSYSFGALIELSFLMGTITDKPIYGQAIIEVAKKSLRKDGRPIGREKLPPDFHDDCGFLLIGEEDLSYFDHVIPEINLNFFSSSDSILHNPLDRLAWTRHG